MLPSQGTASNAGRVSMAWCRHGIQPRGIRCTHLTFVHFEPLSGVDIGQRHLPLHVVWMKHRCVIDGGLFRWTIVCQICHLAIYIGAIGADRFIAIYRKLCFRQIHNFNCHTIIPRGSMSLYRLIQCYKNHQLLKCLTENSCRSTTTTEQKSHQISALLVLSDRNSRVSVVSLTKC